MGIDLSEGTDLVPATQQEERTDSEEDTGLVQGTGWEERTDLEERTGSEEDSLRTAADKTYWRAGSTRGDSGGTDEQGGEGGILRKEERSQDGKRMNGEGQLIDWKALPSAQRHLHPTPGICMVPVGACFESIGLGAGR